MATFLSGFGEAFFQRMQQRFTGTGGFYIEQQLMDTHELANTLDGCHPVSEVLNEETYYKVCAALQSGIVTDLLVEKLEGAKKYRTKSWCVATIRMVIALSLTCSPEIISRATFNLLGYSPISSQLI